MAVSKKEPIKILIVENDEVWVGIIKECLPGNFQLDEAFDIDTIKLLLQRETYDLIIVDLILSDEDEKEDKFSGDVKKIRRNISNLIFAIKQTDTHGRVRPPIIVITAYKIYPYIPVILNDHVGWIWSWHVKDEFDVTTFHRNVDDALFSGKADIDQERAGKPNSEETSILFLAADPTNLVHLRTSEEFQKIQETLNFSLLRDYFKLELPQLSVQPKSFSQALLDKSSQIVHFSGHGMVTGELCFEDQEGQSRPVDPEALAALFEQFADQVNCVLLSACYSEIQATAIAEHIEFVIGMSRGISDPAAIAFAVGFYQALGAGRTIEKAYKLGCVQIRLMGIPEHLTPVLIKNGQFQQEIS